MNLMKFLSVDKFHTVSFTINTDIDAAVNVVLKFETLINT